LNDRPDLAAFLWTLVTMAAIGIAALAITN
jgi:hypothetical protein